MTSLSTVGFGDLHPVSDAERLVGGFMLLFGGAVFSYMSGILIDAILTIGNVDKDIDDWEKLAQFFNTLKCNFNGGADTNKKLKEEIKEYLKGKWENGKTNFLQEESDKYFMEQLPNEVALKIYTDFVYRKFLIVFRRFFSIYKQNQYALMNQRSSFLYKKIEKELDELKDGTLLKENVKLSGLEFPYYTL